MTHPYSGNKASDVAKRRAGKMASGGHVDAKADAGMIKKAMGAHDKQLHGGKHTDLGVIGDYARGGRARKGGKGKKGNNTKINIAIIGGEKKDKAPDMGLPPPPMGGDMPPPPPGGAPGGMPPMAGPPGGMPPGMPPKPPGMMNRGGKVPMRGGADSGVGRLDKVKAYKKG